MHLDEEGARLVVCIDANAEMDLRAGASYRALPDARAAEVGCLQVIDDSGEDYLYAAYRFVMADNPPK